MEIERSPSAVINKCIVRTIELVVRYRQTSSIIQAFSLRSLLSWLYLSRTSSTHASCLWTTIKSKLLNRNSITGGSLRGCLCPGANLFSSASQILPGGAVGNLLRSRLSYSDWRGEGGKMVTFTWDSDSNFRLDSRAATVMYSKSKEPEIDWDTKQRCQILWAGLAALKGLLSMCREETKPWLNYGIKSREDSIPIHIYIYKFQTDTRSRDC